MRSIIVALIAGGLLGGQSAASPIIKWTPTSVERLLFPGQTLRLRLSFRSVQTLSNVSVTVAPALQPILTVSPASFATVVAGNQYGVDVDVIIPATHPSSITYNGTIHLVSGKQTLARPLSLAFDVEPVAFHPPDASNVIVDATGAIYPINQLIVSLQTSFGPDDALAIADSTGGAVVGFAPSTNSFEFEFPTTTTELQLDAISSAIQTDYRVTSVLKNYIGEFSGLTTDVAHLAVCDPNTTNNAAYKIVKVQDAWDFLAPRPGTAFAGVTVGVVDTGILRSHPEFLDLLGLPNVTIDPPSAQIFSEDDIVGHGTAVSGIIGANNLSATFSLDCVGNHALQMNGIIAGLAQINYTLAVVGTKATLDFTPLSGSLLSSVSGVAFYDVLSLTDFLGSRGIPVVNLSFALRKSFLGLCEACVANFDTLTAQFQTTFNRYPTTLFVTAAGDFGGDVSDYTPANLGILGNVVTVGGTDLADNLLDIQGIQSSSGATIGISAPGLVWSPWIGPLWGTFGGTSASAPMVTGTAAILQALGAGDPSSVKYYLTASGDPIPTLDNKPIGGRRLNVFCAVQLVLPPPPGLVMNDDFSEGYRDCSRWFTTVEPPGTGLVSVANQQLDMVKASSSNGYMGLASRCKVAGDFDVQVHYTLSTWPAQNFHTVRLMASDLPDGGTGFPGVYRNSYADENYQFRNPQGAARLVSVSTSDTAGTIGLKRVGQTLFGYAPQGTIGSAPVPTYPTGFTIDFAGPSITAPGNVAIEFDDFKVITGTVVCPQ